MITAIQIPVPEVRSEALRSWLRKPELQELVRIVESKQQTHEAEMTQFATESSKYPAKIGEANESILKAFKYVCFLEVLKEIQDQKTYTTVTLK